METWKKGVNGKGTLVTKSDQIQISFYSYEIFLQQGLRKPHIAGSSTPNPLPPPPIAKWPALFFDRL